MVAWAVAGGLFPRVLAAVRIATARPQFSDYGTSEEIRPRYRSTRHVLLERVAWRITFRSPLRLAADFYRVTPLISVEAPAGRGRILMANFECTGQYAIDHWTIW